MFDSLFGLNSRRKRCWAKAPEGAMKHFFNVPFPENSTLIHQVPILAVDFETTGLDCNKDQLLSIGFVTIYQGKIQLASAKHFIINTNKTLSAENVAIHQITDQEKNQGVTLELAITELLNALSGKAMLAHYAKIEKTFLQQACLQLYGIAPIYPIIDTLVIAKRRLDRAQKYYDPSELRLSALRDSFQLPGHYAHNALNDAIATAELFLVEMANRKTPLTLKALSC